MDKISYLIDLVPYMSRHTFDFAQLMTLRGEECMKLGKIKEAYKHFNNAFLILNSLGDESDEVVFRLMKCCLELVLIRGESQHPASFLHAEIAAKSAITLHERKQLKDYHYAWMLMEIGTVVYEGKYYLQEALRIFKVRSKNRIYDHELCCCYAGLAICASPKDKKAFDEYSSLALKHYGYTPEPDDRVRLLMSKVFYLQVKQGRGSSFENIALYTRSLGLIQELFLREPLKYMQELMSVLLSFADYLASLGSTDRAERLYKSAVNIRHNFSKNVSAKVMHQMDLSAAYLFLAKTSRQRGEFQAAIAAYRLLIAEKGADVFHEPVLYWTYQLDIAEVYELQQSRSKAIGIYNNMYSTYDHYTAGSEAKLIFCRLLVKRAMSILAKDIEETLKRLDELFYYSKALMNEKRFNETVAQGYQMQGDIYLTRGDSEAAMKVYEFILASYASSPEKRPLFLYELIYIRFNLATIYVTADAFKAYFNIAMGYLLVINNETKGELSSLYQQKLELFCRDYGLDVEAVKAIIKEIIEEFNDEYVLI